MKEHAKLLRVLRAEHEPHLTQIKLARLARLNVTRYWQIENGEGLPATDDEREAIADALDVKVTNVAWPERQKARAS